MTGLMQMQASLPDALPLPLQVLHLRQEAVGSGVDREDVLGGGAEEDHRLVPGARLRIALGGGCGTRPGCPPQGPVSPELACSQIWRLS